MISESKSGENLKISGWSLNVGNDYDHFRKESGKRATTEDESRISEIREERNELLRELFSKADLSFYLLQEVGDDLDRVKSWFPENYEVITDGRDTAVVWDTGVFELESLKDGGFKAEYTVVNLTHLKSQKFFQLISAHLAGYHDHTCSEDTSIGNDQLKSLMEKCDSQAHKVLGMDANSDESVYPDRVGIARKHGFIANEKDKAKTNVFDTRKLDYLMVCPAEGYTVTMNTSESIEKLRKSGGDLENAADHRLVGGELEFSLKSSLISRVFSLFLQYVGRQGGEDAFI